MIDYEESAGWKEREGRIMMLLELLLLRCAISDVKKASSLLFLPDNESMFLMQKVIKGKMENY
jgi:hypothetical protein